MDSRCGHVSISLFGHSVQFGYDKEERRNFDPLKGTDVNEMRNYFPLSRVDTIVTSNQ